MCRASLCWSRPVCAGSPASQFPRHGAEPVRMSGDSGVGSGVLMLEWRSLREEEVALPGSTADSCKEVGSGRSFYSGCCGLFVPDDLTAFMTHHECRASRLAFVLVGKRAPAGRGCRPYLCQAGGTAPGDPSYIRVTGYVGLATSVA
ncbi:hypothetical protein BHM03_00004648 [Ensete ventricosum]|nr:hypothetical protein BHM03_00004648 [Ensete ventricosum]